MIRKPIYHYMPLDLPQAIHRTKECYRIVYLSNMIAAKGWQVALTAASRLCAQREDVVVEFYGGTVAEEPLSDIEAAFQRVQYPKRIVYKGRISGIAKWAALAASDVFIFPSNYAPEGLSLVVVEAMAVGLPVITTSVGGLSEGIRPGEGGLIVPPNDASALLMAMEELLSDAGKRNEMGHRNRLRVAERHTQEAHLAAWLGLFTSLLDTNSTH